jgi:alkylhydroperoxidase family enzyme
MEIIDKIVEQLTAHPGTGSSEVLAQALASACHCGYGVSLLAVSVKLDQTNQALVARLANIRNEPDYSNSDQDQALKWLVDRGFIQ